MCMMVLCGWSHAKSLQMWLSGFHAYLLSYPASSNYRPGIYVLPMHIKIANAAKGAILPSCTKDISGALYPYRHLQVILWSFEFIFSFCHFVFLANEHVWTWIRIMLAFGELMSDNSQNLKKDFPAPIESQIKYAYCILQKGSINWHTNKIKTEKNRFNF